MRKALGLIYLLAALVAVACLWEYFNKGGVVNFISPANLRNVLTWVGLFGILSLGQAIVIITGGIDLSVGSVVALIGITTAVLFSQGYPPALVLPGVLLLAAAIGAFHGTLVTKARMQPFIVTLCGLFFYRGVARYIAQDTTQGFGTDYTALKWFGRGYIPTESSLLPAPFAVFLVLAAAVGVYLHLTPQGRRLFALGANEEAARFSGIRTDRLKILAYALCTTLAAFGGLLFAFKVNSLGPGDFGNFYELYAVAGAVLGGCSLRGGSGNVLGVVIGASLIMVLRNLVNILEIPSELEYVVIGGAILVGVFADQWMSRRREMGGAGAA